jgi:hypothetical protein
VIECLSEDDDGEADVRETECDLGTAPVFSISCIVIDSEDDDDDADDDDNDLCIILDEPTPSGVGGASAAESAVRRPHQSTSASAAEQKKHSDQAQKRQWDRQLRKMQREMNKRQAPQTLTQIRAARRAARRDRHQQPARIATHCLADDEYGGAAAAANSSGVDIIDLDADLARRIQAEENAAFRRGHGQTFSLADEEMARTLHADESSAVEIASSTADRDAAIAWKMQLEEENTAARVAEERRKQVEANTDDLFDVLADHRASIAGFLKKHQAVLGPDLT